MTTDFGQEDEYVGVMKGVILSRNPATNIIDLSHGIEPHNLTQAAFLINSGSRYFPDHTIHIVVVDPGVGGTRRLILVGTRRQFFLAPDNGVLSLLLNDEDFTFARAVTNEELFVKPVSHTFHGRDIMAPVAAHLAAGIAAETVGALLDRDELTQLPLAPSLTTDGKGIEGMVIQVDHFGNLVTNIDRQTVQQLIDNNAENKLTVSIGDQEIDNLGTYFDEVLPGELLSLFGSRDYLEIAANQGSAKKLLGVSVKDGVQIKLK